MKIAPLRVIAAPALIILIGACAASPTLCAATPADAQAGNATISFNPDRLAELALRVRDVRNASAQTRGVAGVRYERMTFQARGGSPLVVDARDDAVSALEGSDVRFDGGFSLAFGGGNAVLDELRLRVRAGASFAIDVVDTAGVVWLVGDHAHYAFERGPPGWFWMRHMDLRLSAHLARALGDASWAGQPIGALELDLPAQALAHDPAPSCKAPWPRAGLVTDIELTHSNLSGFWDSVYAPRCGLPPLPNGGACTKESMNGKLVLGADASLRNIGQTAIAWNARFSANAPPYGNDQHPYLIWNLYRIDAAGRIKQIGVSAAKHAFYSINKRCGCAAGNVFWPGCEDIYSFSSNDNGGGEQNLAPRSEIIPFTAQWGRCGSVWDRDCDGRMDAGSGAQDLYQYRMQVTERDLLPPLATGAHYFFEYWYVVREDANIYNSMGYREIALRKSAANWRVNLVGADAPDHDFFLGPVIDRWVDPHANSPLAMTTELMTPRGRAKIAVKVRAEGGGRWRYDYAVMNFDYAHALIDPAHAREPDLKVLSNAGFAAFEIPLSRGITLRDLRFDDVDDDSGNDWSARTSAAAIDWHAPTGNTLDWGTLYAFGFSANAPPARHELTLVGAATRTEKAESYRFELLAPDRSATAAAHPARRD